MATTLPPPQQEVEKVAPRPGHNGNGTGGRGLPPEDGELRRVEERNGEPTRTGIWVGLAAIAMSFAAFTSALYVREGAATDWHPIVLPRILWFNTLALVASSVTLEIARRRTAAFMRGLEVRRGVPLFWLSSTLALGVIFVAGQFIAWLQLRALGLFLPTNPNSSFFYVLTGVHAVHVLGGLGGLLRVIVKFIDPKLGLRRSTMDATSYYWHFMGILWVYLLFILWWKV